MRVRRIFSANVDGRVALGLRTCNLHVNGREIAGRRQVPRLVEIDGHGDPDLPTPTKTEDRRSITKIRNDRIGYRSRSEKDLEKSPGPTRRTSGRRDRPAAAQAGIRPWRGLATGPARSRDVITRRAIPTERDRFGDVRPASRDVEADPESAATGRSGTACKAEARRVATPDRRASGRWCSRT
jgi:hypothetical protein